MAKKRKQGFEKSDISKKAYMEGLSTGERLKPVASPAAGYHITKPAVDGDAEALTEGLNNLVKIAPTVNDILKQKGAEKFLRGDKRPEGILSAPGQEGFDYTEAQSLKGAVFSVHNKKLEKLSAAFDGKDFDKYKQDVQRLTKETSANHVKGRSNAFLAGAQNTLMELSNSSAVYAQKIMSAKQKEIGRTYITRQIQDDMISIVTSNKWDRATQAKLAKGVLTQLQAEGLEKFDLSRNEVTKIVVDALKDEGKTNSSLFDMFYEKKDGIASADTAGGAEVDRLTLAAIEKEKELLPTRAFKLMANMDMFRKTDGTLDFAAMDEELRDPKNWKEYGLDTIKQVNEVKALIGQSNLEVIQKEARVKHDYTIKTVTKGYDFVYPKDGSVGSTAKAIDFFTRSSIDGDLKHRIITGLQTNTQKDNPALVNSLSAGIFNGTVSEEDVMKVMGIHGGIPIPVGNQLLGYFKNVNKEVLTELKNAQSMINTVMTKGGMQIDAFGTIRQGASADAVRELTLKYQDSAEYNRKNPEKRKDFDWKIETDLMIDKHIPLMSEDMESKLSSMKGAHARMMVRIAKSDNAGVSLPVGDMEFSPNIDTIEDFVREGLYRMRMKSAQKGAGSVEGIKVDDEEVTRALEGNSEVYTQMFQTYILLRKG